MKRLAAVGLAVVVGCAVGAASTTTAQAVSVPLQADFGILLPGESATASTEVIVPVGSVVAEAAWTEIAGTGAWSARLCAASGCTDLDDLAGHAVDAGDYRVVIDVTMPADTRDASVTSARGRIALSAAPGLPLTDGALALTGDAPGWIGVLVGGLLFGGGAALLVRRRRDARGAAS